MSKNIQLSDHFTYKRLIRFIFPAIIMMIFTSIYGVVDGLFVSNYVGKTAFSAVNFVYPILNIFGTVGFMFGAGGSALVSKTLGEGDKTRANKIFSMFVYLSIILGLFFTVLGILFLDNLLIALGVSGQMLNDAVIYGRIIFTTLIFLNLQFLFQIFYTTAERPKLGLIVTLAAGIVNIVFDALFIIVFKWGILGAAIATSLSQLVGGIIPLLYFLSKKTKSLIRLVKTKIEFKPILIGCSNGLSELISGISGSLVGTLYNTQLLKYEPENGVAAYGMMMYVGFIFMGIFFGYANGSSPVVSYHYGAKNEPELKNLFKKGIILMGSASLVLFTLSQLFARPLSYVFSGYDEEFFNLAHHGFRIFAISFLFSGIAILGSSFFTALNNGVVSAVISFLRTVVFQVGAVLILPLLFNTDGIWFSIVVAEGLACLLSIALLLIYKKKYKY